MRIGGQVQLKAAAMGASFNTFCDGSARRTNSDSENRSGSKIEYPLVSAKDQARPQQFEKVLSGILMGLAQNSGGFWKGDIPVANVE